MHDAACGEAWLHRPTDVKIPRWKIIVLDTAMATVAILTKKSGITANVRACLLGAALLVILATWPLIIWWHVSNGVCLIAYPHSALSRNWSLSYQEAVWMCSTGDHQACDITYRYEQSRAAVPAGSPADQW